jgi:hypothetical protein
MKENPDMNERRKAPRHSLRLRAYFPNKMSLAAPLTYPFMGAS